MIISLQHKNFLYIRAIKILSDMLIKEDIFQVIQFILKSFDQNYISFSINFIQTYEKKNSI